LIFFTYLITCLCSVVGVVVQAPRSEAMSLLGSLLCLQNHFNDIPVLQPNERDLVIIKCADVKVTSILSRSFLKRSV